MSSLGKNLKYLRKQDKYSQVELANMIGVSQTSIAHYEAGTRQPTIESLMELSQLFNEPIDFLVGNTVSEKSDKSEKIELDQLVDLLVDALVSKNEDQFMSLFQGSVEPFFSIQSITDDVMKQVMYNIGTMWEKGLISEADEHYATNVVRKAFNHYSMNLPDLIKDRKAISFTVGSEKHTLGLEMVNACLKSEGIESLYLGSDLPVRSLEKVIEEYNPNYIFISITMKEAMNSLVHLINYINEKYESEVMIGIGGQGLTQDQDLIKHKNLHLINNVRELVELLKR